MSGTHPPTDSSDGIESNRRNGVLRKLPDLTYLTLLGFLSIPGYLFEPLRPLQPFVLFFLFGLWPLVKSLVRSVRSDGRSPTDWIEIGGKRQRRRTILSFLALQLNPFVQVKGILQIAGHVPILARYRGRLPKPGRFEQTVSYSLPFDGPSSRFDAATNDTTTVDGGTWTVVNGSPTRERSHSWGILTQRYAYDFVVTDGDGRTHTGDGSRPEDYYCYGEPICAPADGVVVSAHDGHRDHHRAGGWLDLLQRDVRGNWVTIEHADGEYSVCAHLKCGSVAVAPGDHVERGQPIGRCGHSGNSTEPHLHFHVQDRPNFYFGMGLPIRFDGVRTVTEDSTRTSEEREQEADRERTYIDAGQRVIPRSDRGE